jgi:hypothetical protein|tara:strand:- start:1049 stop:2287 length:1239 start_codon:yes stop_codon:yes gene_type:complete
LQHTIEDCLEIVAGLRANIDFKLDRLDGSITLSIAKQVFRGTSLSDKQYKLMKEKLVKYSDQFKELDIDIHDAVTRTSMPLRSIDRTKFIKFVDLEDVVAADSVTTFGRRKIELSNLPWIAIRFPFSKKLICKLDNLPKSATTYVHKKGTHTHYYALTEKVAYECIEQFGVNNFEIDSEILELHKEISTWKKEDYVPGIYNNKIKNLPQHVIDEMIGEMGEPCIENMHLYHDKKFMYGLEEVSGGAYHCSILSKTIAERSKNYVHIDSKEHPLQELFKSMIELKRYPINILVEEESAFDILTQTHQIVRNYIPEDQISVLYRMDNHTDTEGYNKYIKIYKLNTPVDKDTKIVYTLKSKLNKPLLKSDCKPITSFSFSSNRYPMSTAAVLEHMDLLIEYCEDAPLFRDWRNKF